LTENKDQDRDHIQVENLKACLGKRLEISPMHGRDLRGQLLALDERYLTMQFLDERTDQVIETRISNVRTIRYPPGFRPKTFNGESSSWANRPEKKPKNDSGKIQEKIEELKNVKDSA
jgi:hypothetical protein